MITVHKKKSEEFEADSVEILCRKLVSFSLGASGGYTVAVSKPMGLPRSRFRATESYGQSP
jgi:hypothetical protein